MSAAATAARPAARRLSAKCRAPSDEVWITCSAVAPRARSAESWSALTTMSATTARVDRDRAAMSAPSATSARNVASSGSVNRTSAVSPAASATGPGAAGGAAAPVPGGLSRAAVTTTVAAVAVHQRLDNMVPPRGYRGS